VQSLIERHFAVIEILIIFFFIDERASVVDYVLWEFMASSDHENQHHKNISVLAVLGNVELKVLRTH
jgi:hypothetical protein